MADPDPTTDNLGKVLTTHELENRLMNLNDAEKQKLCEGELFLSSDSDITAKIFGIIFDIADSFSSNKNKAIELILPCLNENLPSSNARNIIRKYKTLLEKLNNLPDEERSQKLNQELVTRVKTQWKLLEGYFDFEKLTQGVFVEKDQTSRFTIELFIKLGQFREKCSALTWEKICYFLANKYQTTKVPLANAVSTEFWNVQRELNKIRKYPDRKASLLMQEFVPPLPKPKNDDSKTTKPSDSISGDSIKKENIQLESELEEAQTLEMYSLYEELAEMNVLVLKLTKDIEDTSSDLDTIDKERKKQVNLLRYELQKMTQRYNNLKVKLDDNTQKLAHYFPRNVGKRERRKEEKIANLESESLELIAENYFLTERVEELEERLSKSNESYEKERKRVYYYKNKNLNANVDQKAKINDLEEYIRYLENENSKLVEEINDFLNQKEIKTFCNGKYTDEVRMLYYELMSMNVSVHNCGNIIRSVLKRLSNLNIGRLPKKSAASIMMVESRMLALMQAGEAITSSESNVLHFDGTKLNFEELGSFQVVTDSGSYTFGIEDMMSGEAECYFDTFRDILREASSLLSSPEECEGKTGLMLSKIKNVMTDRCVTNASFVQQLKSWRNDILPTVIDNFNDLPDEEKEKLTRINHLFCSIHVVHNLGLYAESAVKEWEKIAAVLSRHGGFQSSNSRTYDILFEISKLCSYTHGDQRNGKAKEWRAYLEDKNIPNKIISFLHHRFNVYFVLGGAAYFHRNHLKDLLSTLGSDNFLLSSILSDIDNKLYLAAFRALGIFNKLVTGPVYRKIEEEGHILELNVMWLELKVLLERCSQNASPLMDGEILLSGVKISDDEIYHELFKETNDVELDTLTQECLEMICCSCALVIVRQLEDQLPGGKFYQPSEDILEETKLCQRTNILSERDFAQMDRKVRQKQNISTIAASGTIMFLNNRTINWLNSKTEEDLEKIVTIARKASPLRIKYYREKKRKITQTRIDSLERKKIQKEVKEQEFFDNKQILLAELEEYGGVWNSEKKMKDELRKLVGPMKLKALQLQVKARKVILSQSVPDPKILQQGTTIEGKYTQFGVTELQSNLAKAISFAEKSVEERATDVIEKLVLRPEDERKAQLEDAKNLIREKAAKFQERDKDSSGEGTSKKKRPKLFGRRIRHKWDDGWHEATVTKVYDEDEYSTDCEFGVEYVGFPGEYEVNLIEDWKNNWVVVCGSANKKKTEKKKNPDQMEVEDRPEFFGKRIDHEWKEGWFKGTVTAIFDENEFDTDCEFEVEYDGYDEHILVELMKDWKEGKVKILSNEEEQGDVTVGRKRISRGTEKKQPKTKKKRK